MGERQSNTGTAGDTEQSASILLVEDEDCVGRMLKLLLEQDGYAVKLATSMAEALATATETPTQLLLSDLRLKDGTGLELMSRLRELGPVRGIMMSGYSEPIYRDRSLQAGFAEYLVKPVDCDELMLSVGRVLAETSSD